MSGQPRYITITEIMRDARRICERCGRPMKVTTHLIDWGTAVSYTADCSFCHVRLTPYRTEFGLPGIISKL